MLTPLPVPKAAEFDDRASALMLDIKSLEVRHIGEITFKTASSKVDRTRREKTTPFGPPISTDDIPF